MELTPQTVDDQIREWWAKHSPLERVTAGIRPGTANVGFYALEGCERDTVRATLLEGGVVVDHTGAHDGWLRIYWRFQEHKFTKYMTERRSVKK